MCFRWKEIRWPSLLRWEAVVSTTHQIKPCGVSPVRSEHRYTSLCITRGNHMCTRLIPVIHRLFVKMFLFWMCCRSHQRTFPAVFRSWLIWLWVYQYWPVPCCVSSTTALTSHERRRPVTTSCAPNSCRGQMPFFTFWSHLIWNILIYLM